MVVTCLVPTSTGGREIKREIDMKSTKLILLHPTIQKQSSSDTNRLWLIFIITFFTTTYTLILITTTTTATSTATASAASSVQLRLSISNALLHYAATINSTHMTSTKLTTATAAVARCAAAASRCNLLVFGLTHDKAPLYPALNFDGRTVILDEDEHLVSRFEQQHPGIKAYNVKYEMRVGEMKSLLESARGEFHGECRPVQNLLFLECKLALNSLPNHVYELSWDVILIDGLSRYHEVALGMAMSKKGGTAEMHVFVQDFDREVEKVYSDEFLCRDNWVEVVGKLGHFVVARASDERLMTEFCRVGFGFGQFIFVVNINGVIVGFTGR